jgi:hypothetical protein
MKNVLAGVRDVSDSVPKALWFVVMVLAFIWFWPLGLAILAYLMLTGRLGDFQGGFKRGWLRTFGSGNVAFDEHREEVLRKIDEEAKQFADFREKLAKAKDRSEFDAFMKEQK